MNKRNIYKKIMGLSMAAVMSLSLAACGGNEEEKQEAVKSADGALGAYEENIICTVGRSTIANPKFPEGDTYEWLLLGTL